MDAKYKTNVKYSGKHIENYSLDEIREMLRGVDYGDILRYENGYTKGIHCYLLIGEEKGKVVLEFTGNLTGNTYLRDMGIVLATVEGQVGWADIPLDEVMDGWIDQTRETETGETEYHDQYEDIWMTRSEMMEEYYQNGDFVAWREKWIEDQIRSIEEDRDMEG